MKKIFFQLCLIAFVASVHAQDAMTLNGNMQVHTGASMSVFGNFTNTASASLLNNGTLYYRNSVVNNQPGMNAGTGTVYLNGTVLQNISGTQAFRVNNLLTSNAAGFTLSNDLSVSGLHTFTAGVITSSTSSNYLVYENGAFYTGDNDARHVKGWVKRTGTTDFIYPLGNGTYERPIALNSLSTLSTFAVTYNTVTPDPGHMQAPIVSVDANEYWTVNRVSGGTAVAALNWNHAKVSFPNYTIGEIRVVAYESAQWVGKGGSATGVATTTGSVSSNALSSFGNITFGSNAYPLPFTLLQFTGKRENGYTALTWKTMQEKAVDHFEVERSFNSVNFETFAKVTAINSFATQTYHANDYLPLTGEVFYRLRAIDVDGKIKLSPIVRIAADANAAQLVLLGNPVTDHLQLLPRGLESGIYELVISSAAGVIIQQARSTFIKDKPFSISLPSMSSGSYLISLKKGDATYNVRFIKL